jgi:hypothetical protein
MNTEYNKGWRAIRFYREQKAPRIAHWMIKHSHGIVKSEDQAGYLLLDLGIIILLVSFYFWFK